MSTGNSSDSTSLITMSSTNRAGGGYDGCTAEMRTTLKSVLERAIKISDLLFGGKEYKALSSVLG